MGLQYRVAALGGIVTQFFWGFMTIIRFRAFYRADAGAFPMSFEGLACYIWLQQAFLTFFAAWMAENEIFSSIVSGDIAYELLRPIGLYDMWYCRSLAIRLSRAVLRCFPILIVAFFLPKPYGLSLPPDWGHFGLFLVTLGLGLCLTVSFCMLVYVLAFFTVSAEGLRILFVSTLEFFSGAVIPLPFFPDKMRAVMELLPFASMMNGAFRIYSGDMGVAEMQKAVFLQVFWLVLITGVGKLLCRYAVKRVTVQGG